MRPREESETTSSSRDIVQQTTHDQMLGRRVEMRPGPGCGGHNRRLWGACLGKYTVDPAQLEACVSIPSPKARAAWVRVAGRRSGSRLNDGARSDKLLEPGHDAPRQQINQGLLAAELAAAPAVLVAAVIEPLPISTLFSAKVSQSAFVLGENVVKKRPSIGCDIRSGQRRGQQLRSPPAKSRGRPAAA